MFNAFLNCFKIPELRQRIFLTLGMIFVARVGSNIPLPGINPLVLENLFANLQGANANIVGMYNMFTGGALSQGAIFALGIMPYISASIILQLMGAVVPSLSRLQQEGETGRQKIAQYTRYLTIAIGVVQSLLLSIALINNPGSLLGASVSAAELANLVIISDFWFVFNSVIFLTTGTVILMWLGEQITQKGVGNGISLLITIGILADLPSAVALLSQLIMAPEGADASLPWWMVFILAVVFVLVVTCITAVTQAQRKIPVQYAKRVVGRKVFGGQSSFLPLKVNYAGVMPVIFASAILMFPATLLRSLGAATNQPFFSELALFLDPGHWFYYVFFGTMILGFSYFWVSIMFKPIQIADDLKKNGGYVPGVRPGEPTAKFLDFVMTRLTLAGAIFLTIIAIFPNIIAQTANIPYKVALFFGGTGTLIAVGVMIDTMRQVETFLLQRHYDGFLQKGKNRSRSKVSGRSAQLVDTQEMKSLSSLWIAIGALLVIGVVAYFLQ